MGCISMDNKFTEDILNEFFETGILKCSAYQLSTILNYAKKQALETKENKDEQYKWVALTKMIITYLSEIEIHLTTANENLKVGFEEYLQKAFSI